MIIIGNCQYCQRKKKKKKKKIHAWSRVRECRLRPIANAADAKRFTELPELASLKMGELQDNSLGNMCLPTGNRQIKGV